MRLRSSPLHPVKGSHLAHALELDPEQHRPTRRRLAKAHWCPRASFRLHTIRQAGPAAKVVHCGHESRSAPVIFCLASMAVGTVTRRFCRSRAIGTVRRCGFMIRGSTPGTSCGAIRRRKTMSDRLAERAERTSCRKASSTLETSFAGPLPRSHPIHFIGSASIQLTVAPLGGSRRTSVLIAWRHRRLHEHEGGSTQTDSARALPLPFQAEMNSRRPIIR